MAGFGVDPQNLQQMPMPDMTGAEQAYQQDPNAMPSELPPDMADPYVGADEFRTRDRVEVCLLTSIESCAKAVQAGEGADNPQFVVSFAQAAASLAQAYQALAGAEAAEKASGVAPSQG